MFQRDFEKLVEHLDSLDSSNFDLMFPQFFPRTLDLNRKIVCMIGSLQKVQSMSSAMHVDSI